MKPKPNSKCFESTEERFLQAIPLFSRILFVTFLAVLFSFKVEMAYSQDAAITLNMKNTTVEKVLNAIEKQSGYSFVYNNKIVNVDRLVNISANKKSLKFVLAELFKGTNINYSTEGKHIILSASNATREGDSRTKKISGTICDEKGEPIVGATVREAGNNTNGAITNAEGKFTLTASPSSTLDITFI